MAYSSSDYWEMLVLYGECGRDAAATAREYAVRFPNRRHPDSHVILRLNNRTRETGVLKPTRNRERPNLVRVPAAEERILHEIAVDPRRSIRTVAAMCDMAYTTTQRVFKENRLHAFHYTRVQNLLPGDDIRRMQFCRWLLQRNLEDPDFVHKIMFTDESHFDRNGPFNVHNSHVWAEENPHAIKINAYQIRFSINLWAGIIYGVLVGPLVIPARLTGNLYRDLLNNDLPEMVRAVPLAARPNMWFQHDGAPPHYAGQARAVLNREFPNAWIGRAGPVAWPARSPDLTPLDYFLWAHIKEYVYSEPVDTVEILEARIHEAVLTVTPDMLRNAQATLIRRAQLCLAMHGWHFEHLL